MSGTGRTVVVVLSGRWFSLLPPVVGSTGHSMEDCFRTFDKDGSVGDIETANIQ